MLLSNSVSLIHVYSNNCQNPIHILGSCKMLKYFIYKSHQFDPSCSLQLNYNLEQLNIQCSSVDIPNTIMEYVSLYDGLTHVVMEVRSVTINGVTTIIGNSPKLLKCYICAYHMKMHMECVGVLQDFNWMLEKKFSNRKVFSGGNYYFSNKYYDNFLTMYNTELTSIWSNIPDIRQLSYDYLY